MTPIRLSDHFTYGRLLRYTLPSIVMMIFTSLYSVVDGLFVSNLVGDLALSAVNIAFPVTMIVGAFGFMLGTGGSAIVARTLGEGKPELASRYFSMFIWCVAGLGVVLSVFCLIFIEPIMRLAGASELLLDDCVRYGGILLAGSAPFMLQSAFQSFFSAAEKPSWGCSSPWPPAPPTWCWTMCSSPCWTWASPARPGPRCWDTAWAASSRCSISPPEAAGPAAGKDRLYGQQLLHACTNGSSELMSNISASVVGILYNIRLMDLLGEPGVAAHSVMMYVDFVFVAAFLASPWAAPPSSATTTGPRTTASSRACSAAAW